MALKTYFKIDKICLVCCGGVFGDVLEVCLCYFGRFSEGKHKGKIKEKQRSNYNIAAAGGGRSGVA